MLAAGIVSSLLLAGCAGIDGRGEGSADDGVAAEPVAALPDEASKTEADAVPERPFPDGTLLDLLAAEILIRRGDYAEALPLYERQALATRDAAVVEMAARLAEHAESPAARTLAELWLDVDPSAIEAREILVRRLLATGELQRALVVAAERPGLPWGALDVWLEQARDATPEQRTEARSTLQRLYAQRPDEHELVRVVAILHWLNGDGDRALALLDTLPADVAVTGTQLEILQALGRAEAAEALLARAIEADGDERTWRLRYAQLQIDAEDWQPARAQLQRLLDAGIDDEEVVLTAAYVDIAAKRNDDARALLQSLLAGRARDLARIYLAQIAESEEQLDAALAHYRAVGVGDQYPLARRESVRLMAALGRLDSARDELTALRAGDPEAAVELFVLEANLLNEADRQPDAIALLTAALADHADDHELLYTRAVTAAELGQVAAVEADLGRILAQEPDHVGALNALGFTLADLTQRYEEAAALIGRALAQEPDNAAIIDSMGWVQYRLEDYDAALGHLRKAWEATENDEIGAHLGEVLWQVGDQTEARRVWQQALDAHPGSAVVERTMRRLIGTPAVGTR